MALAAVACALCVGLLVRHRRKRAAEFLRRRTKLDPKAQFKMAMDDSESEDEQPEIKKGVVARLKRWRDFPVPALRVAVGWPEVVVELPATL